MATEIVERKLDDVYRQSGVRKEADTTVEFSYKGRSFKIDLTTANEKDFDDAIQPFLDAAEEVTGRRKALPGKKLMPTAVSSSTAPKKRPATKPNGTQTEAIRDWARSQNLKVSDRGRIADSVKAAYYAGHPAETPVVTQPAAVPESRRQEAAVEETNPDFDYGDSEEPLYDEDLFQQG
jgi:hypothetical protein